MPNGTIVWCDERSGDARIKRLGHELAARTGDIEPDARVAGVRVHFDLERDGRGERAINVRLLPGLRTSVHQHRRGELTHARADQAGHEPISRQRRWPQPHRERAPSHEIAEIWLRHVRAGELDDALAIYAPDAVVHAGPVTIRGRRAVRRMLVGFPLFDRTGPGVHVADEGTEVVVEWRPAAGAETSRTRLRMRHGEIAEQWCPDLATEGT